VGPEEPSPVADDASEVPPDHGPRVVAASQPQVAQEKDEGGEGEAGRLADGG